LPQIQLMLLIRRTRFWQTYPDDAEVHTDIIPTSSRSAVGASVVGSSSPPIRWSTAATSRHGLAPVRRRRTVRNVTRTSRCSQRRAKRSATRSASRSARRHPVASRSIYRHRRSRSARRDAADPWTEVAERPTPAHHQAEHSTDLRNRTNRQNRNPKRPSISASVFCRRHRRRSPLRRGPI